MPVTIEIVGDPAGEVERAIARLMNKSAMMKYGRAIRKATRDRIKQGVDVFGRPFEAHSEPYGSNKSGPGFLRESGDLFRTLFVESRDGAGEVGTRLDYGTFNQEGRPTQNLPQREWLSVTDKDVRDSADIAMELWEGSF